MPRALLALFVGITGVFFAVQITLASDEDVVINEVYYDAIGTDTGFEFIELYNRGDSSVELTGWDIDPSSTPYFTLPKTTIEPSGYLTIFINTEGENSTTKIFTGTTSNMSNTKGPIALFSSNKHNEESLIDFIQYGDGGQTNESKAVEIGLWLKGNFIPDVIEGLSISFDENRNWYVGNPTPGEANKPHIKQVVQESKNHTDTKSNTNVSRKKPVPKLITHEPINETPAPYFEIPEKVFINQTVRFDASNSTDDLEIKSYQWDFGNGNGMYGEIADYAFSVAGIYKIQLTISDGELKSSLNKEIFVTDNVSEIPYTLQQVVSNKLLAITEILPNPDGIDTEGEWIEIVNKGDQLIELFNWSLDDKDGGSKPYTFPIESRLAPRSFLVIDREESKIALNNTVDHVRLITPYGKIYSDYAYTGVKEGKSLVVVDNELVISESLTPGSNHLTKASTATATIPLQDNASTVPHGTPATFEGVVTATPSLFAKRYFYIQLLDEQRENLPDGMQIYMQSADFPELSIGDVVALSGTISLTGDEPKLLIADKESIYKQSEILDVYPVDKPIHELADNDLGSLILIEGEVVDKSGKSLYVLGERDEVRIYIQPNTNIQIDSSILGSFVQITGILSKTKSGYRILPRSQIDIEVPQVAGLISESSTISDELNNRDSLVNYLIATVVALVILLFIVTLSLKKRLNLHTIATTEKERSSSEYFH